MKSPGRQTAARNAGSPTLFVETAAPTSQGRPRVLRSLGSEPAGQSRRRSSGSWQSWSVYSGSGPFSANAGVHSRELTVKCRNLLPSVIKLTHLRTLAIHSAWRAWRLQITGCGHLRRPGIQARRRPPIDSKVFKQHGFELPAPGRPVVLWGKKTPRFARNRGVLVIDGHNSRGTTTTATTARRSRSP